MGSASPFGSGVARKMLEGSCVPFPDNYLICLPQIKTVHRNRTETRQSRASRTHGPCDGGALRSPTPAQCTPRRTLPMPSASASRSSATGSSRKGKRRAGPASGKHRVGAAQKPAAGRIESVDLTVTSDEEDAQADDATCATGTVQTTCAAMVAAADAHKQHASAPQVGGAFDLASLTEKFKQAAEHAAKQAAEQAEKYINESDKLRLAEIKDLREQLVREQDTGQVSQRQRDLLRAKLNSKKSWMNTRIDDLTNQLNYARGEMSAAQQHAEDASRHSQLLSEQIQHIRQQHDKEIEFREAECLKTEVENDKRAAADLQTITVMKRKLAALEEVEELNRCAICLHQLREIVTAPFLFCNVKKAPPHFVCQGCHQMQFDNTNPLDPALLRCQMPKCGGMFSVADQERVLGPERCAIVVQAQDDARIAAAEERGAERARAGDCKLTQEDYIDATIDRMPCCGRKHDPLATCIDEGECAVIFCPPCQIEFCAFCHEQFPLHDYVNNDGQESAGHAHLRHCQQNHFEMLEDGTLASIRYYHLKKNPQAIASLKACMERRVAERLAKVLAKKVADAGN